MISLLRGKKGLWVALCAVFAIVFLGLGAQKLRSSQDIEESGRANPLNAVAGTAKAGMEVVRFFYSVSEQVRDLRAFTVGELEKLKPSWVNEKDPLSGKTGRWRGHAIHLLVDEVIKALPPEEKAKVDLLILKARDGKESLIPRAFTVRHPYYLVFGTPKAPIPDGLGPFFSLLPLKSLQAGLEKDGLPTERFLLHQIEQVELANMKDRFGMLTLQKRSDPVAVRGEKVFLNSCLTCHGVDNSAGVSASGSAFAQRILKAESAAEKQGGDRLLASQNVIAQHPSVSGFPKLQEAETRAIGSYLRAFSEEKK